MNQATSSVTKRHFKAMIIGGGTLGIVGAGLGYLMGFTSEGAAGGFFVGWLVGEIVGLAAVS